VFIGISRTSLTAIVSARVQRRVCANFAGSRSGPIPEEAHPLQSKRKVLALALALVLAPIAAATAAGDGKSPVALDDLLQLPTSLDLEPASRGRYSKAEWRERFDEARAELADAKAALAETQQKIADLSGDTPAWKVATPGLGGVSPGPADETPLDLGLSAEMRRNREEVARCERRLTELEIEANLASVPADWRGAAADDQPSDAASDGS